MSWSPFAEEILADPAQGHRELLQRCPVHRCDEFDPPFYTLSRYADVENALRDINTFSSQYGQGPRFSEPVGMLCDPPQHTYMRKIIQHAFTPNAMVSITGRVNHVTQELVDNVLSGDKKFDLHDDFAFPLPVTIVARMLGVPTSDLEQFKRWSDIQVAAMGAENPQQYADDQAEFFSYMQQHFQSKREALRNGSADVADDLLTWVAGAHDPQGQLLADADAMSVIMQLLVGGNETTTSLITNMLWRLLQAPDRWQMIVHNPSLIPAVVEESLRYDPPVLGLYRNTTTDVVVAGETIPANSKVWLNYAAANRDPTVFENPDEFDLQREHKRHMSFGLGVHFCLGAPMAKLEAEIALTALVARMPKLQLLGSGERIAPFFLWGRRKLPVAYA